MKHKWLAIGIILLFVGVTIAPAINFNTVKASQDDDLIEVTSEVCGITGYKDITVKLTREQYQNLEQYLVEFRGRLNQTTTREEAVPLFKEAVVELDTYGLLPKGMSVEQAQKLVTGFYQKPFERKLNEKQHMIISNLSNVFCLIYAEATTYSGYSVWMPIGLFILVAYLAAYFLRSEIIINLVVGLSVLLSYLIPIKIMNIIAFMNCNLKLQTIGLLGNTKGETSNAYAMFVGYTGLVLSLKKPIFLGSAIGIGVI